MNDSRAHALDLAEDKAPTASNVVRVAAQTSPDDARWAFAQWALRERAGVKFSLARQMLFDREGLEMATGERIAAYHASRFPKGEAVVDLTCGIGADLMALASRGPARGFEIDPERAELARHNLAVHSLAAEVVEEDSMAADWVAEYAFCDPARRRDGRRTLRIEEFAPDPSAVAERFRYLRLGGIKLSPMLADADLEALGGRTEFVSYGGECREALVWIARGAGPAEVVAVHLESGLELPSGGVPDEAESPREFLFEADPAAIRAHCLGVLCERYGLTSLGGSNGYMTGDRLVDSPWMRAFHVLAHHTADLKRTRAEIRRLGGGTPIVKCRGAAIDVEKVRQDLRGEGEELVLAVYPYGRSLRHVVCRRAKAVIPPLLH